MDSSVPRAQDKYCGGVNANESTLGPCYCPAPGRTTFLLQRLIFWPIMPIGKQLCLKSDHQEKERRRRLPESLRSDLQWTMSGGGGGIDFHGSRVVTGGFSAWKCISREVTEVEDRAKEIKDFQPIEQLNSREKRHFTNSK